jgi:hypothetical protein
MVENGPRNSRSYQVAAELRPPRAVSAACLMLAGVSFVAAWMLAYAAAPELCEFFYQPRVLAIVHTLTLGWISLTIIGVLYQFVPALTKHAVTWPAGAALQVALFAAGSFGMIVSFWFGWLATAAWSASSVFAATLLFTAQLAPGLARAPRLDATVIGVLCALVYFTLTALLGMLYAWDKVYALLGGSVLSNVAGHAHLGLAGWITLMICAVSYRVVTAFLLPTEPVPVAARHQVIALAVVVPLLSAMLLLRSRWAAAPALAGCGALIWYAMILAGIARTRRLPVDWWLRHVIAALAHLFAALLCGMLLFVIDAESSLGSRLAGVYGLLLLVGWISNYIVGIGSRMAPGLMGLGAAPLLSGRIAAAVFVLLNAGIAAVAASLLAGNVEAFRLSVAAPLGAALLFIGNLIRRASARRHGSPATV